MPIKTQNYELVKPLDTEYYDINVQNGNMDIIDREIKKNFNDNNKRIDEMESKIIDNQLTPFKTDILRRLDNLVIIDKVEPKNANSIFWLHDVGDTFIPSVGDGIVIANASFNADKGIKFEEIK